MGKNSTYRLEPVSETCFLVYKDGVKTYRIDFKAKRWVCSCPARKECRHLKLLPAEVLVKRFSRVEIEEAVKLFHRPFSQFQWEVCGSYRRQLPDSKDIDIIILCSQQEFEAIRFSLGGWDAFEYIDGGNILIHGKLNGIPIDITRVTCKEDWAPTLLYRTGPRDFNIRLRQQVKDNGYKLNEHGIEGYPPFYTEEELFTALGMPYIPPERRF